MIYVVQTRLLLVNDSYSSASEPAVGEVLAYDEQVFNQPDDAVLLFRKTQFVIEEEG